MSQIYLGPPFSNFRLVRNFPRPGEGAWAVARLSPSTGQIVLQMGANAPQEHPEGPRASAGFETDIIPDVGGDHLFGFNVDVGPVSLLPRGAHTMLAWVLAYLFGPSVSKEVQFLVSATTGHGFVGRNYGPQMLMFNANLQKGVKYTLGLFNFLEMDYSGLPNPAPYCEIIATWRSATEITPDQARGVQAEETGSLAQHLANTDRQVLEVTDQEIVSTDSFVLK